MHRMLPVACASLATLACAATFAWLAAPVATDRTAVASRELESGAATLRVKGREAVHYLTFRLRYTSDPAHVSPVPIEAAVMDVLIEAAPTTPGLLRADAWRDSLERIVAGAHDRLGVSEAAVIDAERRSFDG